MWLAQCRGGHPGAMGTCKLYQAFPMSGWPAAGWERANSMWLATRCALGPGDGGTCKLYVAGCLLGFGGGQEKDPKRIRAVCRGPPPKRPNLNVIPGTKPPRPPTPPPPEDKKKKAKRISYNIGNTTLIHGATITANEKEKRNAQATKAIRLDRKSVV